VIETVDRIRAALPQLLKWIPQSINVFQLSDRTTTFGRRWTTSSSLCCSAFVGGDGDLSVFAALWPTFIASITVPLALAGTTALMYLLHYSVDNLSLMAIHHFVGFVGTTQLLL